MKIEFPQITRRIAAKLYRQVCLLLKLTTVGVFTLVVFLNFHTQLFPENEEFVKLKLLTLRQPSNYLPYVNLASYLEGHGLKHQAYRLFQTAQTLFNQGSVLGVASPLTAYQQLVMKEEAVKEELAYWKKIVEEKPDFRDAYLQLGAIYYRLGYFKESEENFSKAFQIDPLYPNKEMFQLVP